MGYMKLQHKQACLSRSCKPSHPPPTLQRENEIMYFLYKVFQL